MCTNRCGTSVLEEVIFEAQLAQALLFLVV
jgi:hypothetical protein